MKQILLQGKLTQTDNTILSIINPYANGAFPYWISNPTGAMIHKLKIMAGRFITGKTGGSVTVNLYATQDAMVPIGTPGITSQGMTADYIKTNWNLIGSLDYSNLDNAVEYAHDFKITDIKLDTDSFLIAVVDIAGDIQVKDLFLWIDYENNPLS